MAVKTNIKKTEASAAARYFEGIGRRKTAVARVRITKGKGEILVNNKLLDVYFTLPRFRQTVKAPTESLKIADKFNVGVKVKGGGVTAQAEAIRHGLARALVLFNKDFKKRLRGLGYLTRDSRMVERKKYGLKKARRAPQWQKR